MPFEPPLRLEWGPSRPPERPRWPLFAYPRASWTHYVHRRLLYTGTSFSAKVVPIQHLLVEAIAKEGALPRIYQPNLAHSQSLPVLASRTCSFM